ncbi:MAG: mannose-1-phosphate guanylyltransferase [Flavobacteriaceae bacterium]|nr:mannose-1-phosphate guanylyltransferase [Flavobacteriaceae bacterium]
MNKNYYAIIMAGGIGSRFWPMSTREYPKQFHDMLGIGESLLQRTFNRFAKLIPKENIFISTNKNYKNLVLEQLPTTNEKQLLLEPIMRNTAPCILYASLKINDLNKDAIIVVAPSDHWIENETEFLKNVTTAFKACAKKEILMTLGIQPSNPNTGYGYIQYDVSTNLIIPENSRQINSITNNIKKVANFTEKPNLKKAKQFINEGNYLWNAGIFVWSSQSILNAFQKHLPKMKKILCSNNKIWNTDFENDFIENNYKNLESISIDFGILEKATNVHVLPVEFGWNDLGTWGSLYEKLPKDDTKNTVVNAKTLFRNASNNMVRTSKGKYVVIQGLNNFIVVEKDDVLLICPKNEEQDIKQIVTEVKEKFKKKLT